VLENIPSYIAIVFGITTLLTVYIFSLAARNSKWATTILLGWLILQSVLSLRGFYTFTNSIPPRFALLVLPPLLFIISLFIFPAGKKFIDGLDAKILTYLHTVRIPVEFVLYLLFIHKQLPKLMTFEGRNFDILSGISAPFIAYFGYNKMKLSKSALLIWNFICLALLVNVVVNGFLSAPFPFQQFGFDQPNVAVLYFPFTWLPGCVIQLVLLSHLASIRQLLIDKK